MPHPYKECGLTDVTPIGIYCYFDFDLKQKSCEVFDLSNTKRQ